MATTLWVIAGILWMDGSRFQFAVGSPSMGAMYIAIGCMNIVVGMAQAS